MNFKNFTHFTPVINCIFIYPPFRFDRIFSIPEFFRISPLLDPFVIFQLPFNFANSSASINDNRWRWIENGIEIYHSFSNFFLSSSKRFLINNFFSIFFVISIQEARRGRARKGVSINEWNLDIKTGATAWR